MVKFDPTTFDPVIALALCNVCATAAPLTSAPSCSVAAAPPRETNRSGVALGAGALLLLHAIVDDAPSSAPFNAPLVPPPMWMRAVLNPPADAHSVFSTTLYP